MQILYVLKKKIKQFILWQYIGLVLTYICFLGLFLPIGISQGTLVYIASSLCVAAIQNAVLQNETMKRVTGIPKPEKLVPKHLAHLDSDDTSSDDYTVLERLTWSGVWTRLRAKFSQAMSKAKVENEAKQRVNVESVMRMKRIMEFMGYM